jgi:hypothetical protein
MKFWAAFLFCGETKAKTNKRKELFFFCWMAQAQAIILITSLALRLFPMGYWTIFFLIVLSRNLHYAYNTTATKELQMKKKMTIQEMDVSFPWYQTGSEWTKEQACDSLTTWPHIPV